MIMRPVVEAQNGPSTTLSLRPGKNFFYHRHHKDKRNIKLYIFCLDIVFRSGYTEGGWGVAACYPRRMSCRQDRAECSRQLVRFNAMARPPRWAWWSFFNIGPDAPILNEMRLVYVEHKKRSLARAASKRGPRTIGRAG